MKVPKIQTVCGFGCGSSLMLRMNVEKIAKEHNIQIICGLDSHYVKEENSIKRDQILKYKNINYPDERDGILIIQILRRL